MNTAGSLLNFTELLEEEDQNIEEKKNYPGIWKSCQTNN